MSAATTSSPIDFAGFDLFHPRPTAYDPLADARAILAAAVERYRPSSIWGLFSGGHDSLLSTWIASEHPLFRGAVNFHTGFGIKEARRYAYETSKEHGWPFRVHRPLAVDRYETFVLQHGFPGPAQHGRMYNRLKERSLERHIKASKTRWNDRVMLVTGCRLAESTRRMGVALPAMRIKTRVWVAPILRWDDRDKEHTLDALGLAPSPVYGRLCFSGECLCGAYAKPGQKLDLRAWYPRNADEIDRLEARAAAAGVPCAWGERPPEPCEVAVDEAQADMGIANMCWGCDARRSA